MLIDFRTLWPKYGITPKGVLHVGANIGEEAPVYLELGVKKQIWIEANPEIYDRLVFNIRNNPEARAINACISDTDDEIVTFHVSSNASQSSSILELGTHAIVHPDVHYVRDIVMKARRLDTIDIGPEFDFLNIDLQGAELKALIGLGDKIEQFKWIYLEVNSAKLYKGCPLVEDLDEFLRAFGFNRVETMWAGATGWGDALYIK